MKRMILIIILALSSNLWAQGIILPEGISANGRITLNCNGNDWKMDVPARLEVTTWAEGKARIGLFLGESSVNHHGGSKHHTQNASLHFVALDNGFGSYEIFENDKNLHTPIGELVLFKTSSSIKFYKSRTVVRAMTDYDNNGWNKLCAINTSTAIKFNVVTPKCFNKRGKEISCPEIKY